MNFFISSLIETFDRSLNNFFCNLKRVTFLEIDERSSGEFGFGGCCYNFSVVFLGDNDNCGENTLNIDNHEVGCSRYNG